MTQKKKLLKIRSFRESWKRDLNSRPLHYEKRKVNFLRYSILPKARFYRICLCFSDFAFSDFLQLFEILLVKC